MASAEMIAMFQVQLDACNAQLAAYELLEAGQQDAGHLAMLQESADSAQLCFDNPNGIIPGRTNEFQATFATDDTIAGAVIEIQPAHNKGTIRTGYQKVYLTGINGIANSSDASGAGNVEVKVFARPTGQSEVRGIGEGTEITTQVVLTSVGVVSGEIDTALSKSLIDDPIDVTPCEGYKIFLEIVPGPYTLHKPSLTLDFEGVI